MMMKSTSYFIQIWGKLALAPPVLKILPNTNHVHEHDHMMMSTIMIMSMMSREDTCEMNEG